MKIENLVVGEKYAVADTYDYQWGLQRYVECVLHVVNRNGWCRVELAEGKVRSIAVQAKDLCPYEERLRYVARAAEASAAKGRAESAERLLTKHGFEVRARKFASDKYGLEVFLTDTTAELLKKWAKS